MSGIDYSVVALFLGAMLGVGFFYSRRVKSSDRYFGSDRTASWWMSGISFYMNSFSALGFVMYSALAYKFGWVPVTVSWLSVPAVLLGAWFLAVSSRVYYGMPGHEVAGPNPQLTRIEGVTMKNVHCDWALRAVTLLCDPDYPARNFRLENVVVDEVFENFVRVENVDGIKLDVTARKIHPDAHW